MYSQTLLDHIPALPLGAKYSCPAGADPAATSEANNAKMTDFGRDMIKAFFFLRMKRLRDKWFYIRSERTSMEAMMASR